MILPTTPTHPRFTVHDDGNFDWIFTIDNSNNICSIYSVSLTNEYYALPSFSVYPCSPNFSRVYAGRVVLVGDDGQYAIYSQIITPLSTGGITVTTDYGSINQVQLPQLRTTKPYVLPTAGQYANYVLDLGRRDTSYSFTIDSRNNVVLMFGYLNSIPFPSSTSLPPPPPFHTFIGSTFPYSFQIIYHSDSSFDKFAVNFEQSTSILRIYTYNAGQNFQVFSDVSTSPSPVDYFTLPLNPTGQTVNVNGSSGNQISITFDSTSYITSNFTYRGKTYYAVDPILQPHYFRLKCNSVPGYSNPFYLCINSYNNVGYTTVIDDTSLLYINLLGQLCFYKINSPICLISGTILEKTPSSSARNISYTYDSTSKPPGTLVPLSPWDDSNNCKLINDGYNFNFYICMNPSAYLTVMLSTGGVPYNPASISMSTWPFIVEYV